MRNVNCNVLSANDNLTTNGNQVDANQLVSASFHFYFSDATAAGTCKLQASNDIAPARNMVAIDGFQVTNWVDIPNQSSNITTGAQAILTIANSTYRWLRAVYTSTATGVQTVQPIADTGVKQTQTITAVADVAGSLNNTYFLCSSINLSSKAQKNFYVWFDNGAGVDPALPGKTGVQVTYTDNDTADDVANAARTALAALTNDFTITGATDQIIITNKAAGPVPSAADGAAPTGFDFGSATAGVVSNLINKYFLLNAPNGGTQYYVWMNVDSIGTDPAVAGKTGVPIVFSSGSTAGTIGTAITSAVDALAAFAATGTTTVTITNAASGPFVPASDVSTGFTIAQTAGGTGVVNVNLNALSL